MTVPGTSIRGLPWMEVVVESIDGHLADVVDQFGQHKTVRIDVMRAKGVGAPEVGERWMIDRALGFWTFAAVIGSPASGGGGPIALGDLTDVADALDPEDNYVLAYNEAAGRWEARPAPAAVTALAGLSDVADAISPSDGFVLTFDTAIGQWTAQAVPSLGLAQLSDVADTLLPSNGWLLVFNQAAGRWEAQEPSNPPAVTKFAFADLALATDLLSAPDYTWVPIDGVATRGLVWRMTVVAAGSLSWALQVNSLPNGVGEVMFEAVGITVAEYSCSWPWVFENHEDPADDKLYLGIRNISPGTATFTLTDLRGDRFA